MRRRTNIDEQSSLTRWMFLVRDQSKLFQICLYHFFIESGSTPVPSVLHPFFGILIFEVSFRLKQRYSATGAAVQESQLRLHMEFSSNLDG